MAEIDSNLVLKLAGLARISLSEDQIAPMVENLDKIFGYVKSLQSIDVSNIEPLTHVHDTLYVQREDILESSVAIEEVNEKILKNVPEKSGNFIKVPLVIEQD